MKFKENTNLTSKEARKKYTYLQTLINCYASAINRLNPLSLEFNDNFDKLFEEQHALVQELNSIIEDGTIVICE